MAAKPQPATRIRTCRACGTKFEYPVKGSPSTRHHCADCAGLPPGVRKVSERLFLRIQKLELALARAKSGPPAPIISGN